MLRFKGVMSAPWGSCVKGREWYLEGASRLLGDAKKKVYG